MYILNSFKVFLSNYSLVYKVWAYRLIVVLLLLAVSFAILLPPLVPVFEDLKELGVINMATEYFTNFSLFQSGESALSVELSNIISITKDVLINHAGHLLQSYIGIVVIVVLNYFFKVLCEVPSMTVLLGYMELQANFGFMTSLLSNFKKSLRYTCSKIIIFLPIDIVVYGLPALILFSAKGFFLYFAPFFAFLVFAILMALKTTFSTCWLAEMIVEEKSALSSFKASLSLVSEKFGRIFTIQLFSIILGFAITCLLTIFTFGVSNVIINSIFLTISQSICLVIYFNVSGKRFYVDANTIIEPKKYRNRDYIFELKDK